MRQWLEEGKRLLEDWREDPARVTERLFRVGRSLGVPALSRASEIYEWPLLGAGIQVGELSAERVGVFLADSRRSQWSQGSLAMGMIVLAAEYAMRLLFMQHVSKGFANWSVIAVQMRLEKLLEKGAAQGLWLKWEWRQSEREAFLQRLALDRDQEFPVLMNVLSHDGLKLGEVELTVKFHIVPQIVGR